MLESADPEVARGAGASVRGDSVGVAVASTALHPLTADDAVTSAAASSARPFLRCRGEWVEAGRVLRCIWVQGC